MTDEQNEKRFDDLERQNNRIIRLLGDMKTVMATASVQAVGTGEAVHALMGRMDKVVDDAEDESKVIGANENRITTKQEQLLDLQIWNARGSRILIVIGIISAVVGGTMSVLAFLKWYVHV